MLVSGLYCQCGFVPNNVPDCIKPTHSFQPVCLHSPAADISLPLSAAAAPTSFEGPFGKIIYRVRAVIDTPRFSKDHKAQKPFYLLNLLDLNDVPDIEVSALCQTAFNYLRAEKDRDKRRRARLAFRSVAEDFVPFHGSTECDSSSPSPLALLPPSLFTLSPTSGFHIGVRLGNVSFVSTAS